jgi:purine-binding chemotaxis protein CheW
MTTVAQNAPQTLTQWVTFKLDGETYGVNVMEVQEVLRVTDIAPVPGAPNYVLGIINLRGNVVSVLDTRRRFGLQTTESNDATRIVIIESGGQTVGIRVDAVAEVLDVDSSEIESSPDVGNDEAARYISGMVSRGDELVILIDVHKIISEET